MIRINEKMSDQEKEAEFNKILKELKSKEFAWVSSGKRRFYISHWWSDLDKLDGYEISYGPNDHYYGISCAGNDEFRKTFYEILDGDFVL